MKTRTLLAWLAFAPLAIACGVAREPGDRKVAGANVMPGTTTIALSKAVAITDGVNVLSLTEAGAVLVSP